MQIEEDEEELFLEDEDEAPEVVKNTRLPESNNFLGKSTKYELEHRFVRTSELNSEGSWKKRGVVSVYTDSKGEEVK